MKNYAPIRLLVITSLLAFSGCGQSATTPVATTSSPGNAPANSTSVPNAQTPAASEPTPPSAPPVVVHSGATLTVTVDQTVSSKTSNPGDHFDASIATPVMVDGQRVIPRGARVIGAVTDAKSAGKFAGNAAITVTLDSITVNGERYELRTSSVTEAGKGRGKRTGVGAGGGAVVGGIIGAIAGGGKGAAIGAGAGAGAGAAGAGFTGNRDIEIAAETKLSFKLKAPLELKGN